MQIQCYCKWIFLFCSSLLFCQQCYAMTYNEIDKFVSGRDQTPYGSAWDTDYGYNQPYPLNNLSRRDSNGPNYNWLPAYHAGIDISIPNNTPIYSLTQTS